MEKTVFVLRHVFHEDCMFPDTLRKAEMMALEVHGIAEWEPAQQGALDLDEAGLEAICAEKDAALAEARAMQAAIDAATTDLPEPGRSQLRDTFSLYTIYVEGFRACARACFAVRFHRSLGTAATEARARAEIDALGTYRDALARGLDGTRFAYLVYWMLDVSRLELAGAGSQRQDLMTRNARGTGSATTASPSRISTMPTRRRGPKLSS